MSISILLTGSTGFIGQNIMPMLCKRYTVTAPSRIELDLLDHTAVRDFLTNGHFDAVIHLANPTGQSSVDVKDELFERSLKVFYSLTSCFGLYGKMIYLGSGAEYGKHRAISNTSEEDFGVEIPQDQYGFARYLMNELAEKHNNITNFRLFACHGPSDPPYKLIPHIISCAKEGNAIKLRQDVWFDFLYVEDIYPVLEHFIENPAKHKAYNLCSGERMLISSIADEVCKQMNAKLPIIFEKDGLGLEYTGSNARLREAVPNWTPRPMGEGIGRILEHENRKS